MTSGATQTLQATDLVGTRTRGPGPVPGEHGRSPHAAAHAYPWLSTRPSPGPPLPVLLTFALLQVNLQGKQCGLRTLKGAPGTPAFPQENQRHPSLRPGFNLPEQ